MSARQEWILPFVKWVLFFLGPWLLVYQFIDISNQIEANGHVSNFGKNNLCNSLSYKKIVFEVWDVAIYLHLIGNFCKLAQGPKKQDWNSEFQIYDREMYFTILQMYADLYYNLKANFRGL